MAFLAGNDETMQASAVLAIAITVHTVEESFQAPSYQQKLERLGLLSSNDVFASPTAVLLDSLPIFAVLPLAVYLTNYWPWIRDSLMVVATLHPLLDHVVLSRPLRLWRPGSFTALGVLFPLGISYWGSSSRVGEGPFGIGIGLLVSILLYIAAQAEISDATAQRR